MSVTLSPIEKKIFKEQCAIWGVKSIYSALHNVGDDYVKSDIADCLKLLLEPRDLNTFKSILSKCTGYEDIYTALKMVGDDSIKADLDKNLKSWAQKNNEVVCLITGIFWACTNEEVLTKLNKKFKAALSSKTLAEASLKRAGVRVKNGMIAKGDLEVARRVLRTKGGAPMKTFEISANGHLFGYWRADSEESAHQMICRQSCTNEPIDTYEIIHHPHLDQLSDEEIYDLNLRVLP